jgi:4-hydroxy-tetrahydrodipicolinate synthase
MVTPFTDDGGLDLDGAATVADWLVNNGSDGLVLCGSTGESPVLSDAEEVALTRVVRDAVRVPILLGTGSNDTAYATEAARRSAELGVDGLLVVGPYYNRPPQSGIDAHYRAVATATDLPVVIYDVPPRTGRKISTDTIVRLLTEVPNIVALKDAAGNPQATAEVIARAGDSIEVYSGDDGLTLPLLAVGAVGVVSVASHWVGRQTKAMVEAFLAGDIRRAREINATLLPSFAYASSDEAPNPIPTKAMLRVLGLPVGQCRLPLGPAPDGLDVAARAILEQLN